MLSPYYQHNQCVVNYSCGDVVRFIYLGGELFAKTAAIIGYDNEGFIKLSGQTMTKYHYAISNDGGHHFRIYRAYEFIEQFALFSFDKDESACIKDCYELYYLIKSDNT